MERHPAHDHRVLSQLTSKSLTESFREYLDDNKLPTDGGSAEVLAAMRKLYKVDDSYTDAQARLIVGVRYELDGAAATPLPRMYPRSCWAASPTESTGA